MVVVELNAVIARDRPCDSHDFGEVLFRRALEANLKRRHRTRFQSFGEEAGERGRLGDGGRGYEIEAARP
jgi:hypothetical protein